MYTRFNLKKKKKKRLMLFALSLLAIIIAILLIKIVSLNPSSKITFKEDKPTEVKSTSYKYICIQTGVYEDKDNAQTAFKQISSLGNPFSVDEGNTTRVLLGIYPEKQGEKLMEEMSAKNIPNSKFNFEIPNNGLCSAEIGEIVNADIVVLDRLCDTNVEAVQTKDLKTWIASLKAVDKNSKGFDTLENLKKYIATLPNEITKEKANENYKFLFGLLKKYKVN